MKLRRKLLAAGLALGATALTLTTSTFAWYTANTEVSMTGVQGASAGASGATLLISSVSTQGTFGSSVTLTTNVIGLQPVQYTSSTSGAPTFNTFTLAGTAAGAAAAGSEVLAFDLYFKGAASTPVNFKKLEVKATGSMTAKDILTTEGTQFEESDMATTSTYTVNIVRTLKIAWYTETVNGTTTTTSASVAKKLDNIVTATPGDSITDASKWNAHEYYNVIAGKSIATTEASAVTEAFALNAVTTLGTTPGTANGQYLHAKFYVFIDGWDLQCFDAVQGQTFTVDMEFTSNTDTYLSKTVD